MAERETTEDGFSNLFEKNNIFQIHQNRKVINEKLNVERKKEKEKKES